MAKLLLFLIAAPLAAGPLEFGLAELQGALAARGLSSRAVRFQTGINTGQPESYEIAPGRIEGGDLRGLMYGLLEAASQIRTRGRLFPAKGSPRTPIRGIRYFLHNADLEQDWYYSRDYWDQYFAMLARDRFNRFNLVFAHQTNYLAPPYPFWLELPGFLQIRVPGLTAAQRDRNLEMLRYIAQCASDHGIDFVLGIWEHNIQARMKPTVEGLTRENIGPYSHAALKKILELCPAIRSVQMRTNIESGIPNDQQVEFYRDYVFRAIREEGRWVALDLRAWAVAGGMIEAAQQVGVPLRVSTKYWAEDLGRPYQPAETYPGYSYLNFLEKPRTYDFYWELWALGSNRLLLWGDPDYVRRAVSTFDLAGSKGFEIDPPLAQKGFGNRPGKWGVFTEAQKNRVFWKWEFERYWLFYELWGRLSYDPKLPDSLWLAELQQRFGPAAEDVLEAYRQASRVLPEIVAAHLADPNMYLWPEINPGGLIDAYKDVLPSDWRFIASIREAVGNRIRRVASAKQTPRETAARLDEIAQRAQQAVSRARAKIEAGHREWRSSEPDFLVLAALARYHARKQVAAEQLTYFDETGDRTALDSAKRDLTAALDIWEKLVRLTDGLYPAEMAFGPDDVGHWKDKLPYVRHDLELIREREEVLERFGRFDFGFDFGGPAGRRAGPSYRNDPYVLRNNLDPRFRPVEPETSYQEPAGYGWVTDGPREAVAIPLTPYLEVRAVAKEPKHLPRDVLFRDYIRGEGRQYFRVKTGPGDYTVLFLHPDRTVTPLPLRAENGYLTIPFPQGPWLVSGLVVKGPRSDAPLPSQTWPNKLPRPSITHDPAKAAEPNKPLMLRLRVSPAAHVTTIRLHYRPVNQLAKFQTLETTPMNPSFAIPAADISPRWDLMYYFEVLNKENSGWFDPDPWVSTPYYVVKIERTPSSSPTTVAQP